MKSEEEASRVIELYADMVKRICFLHLKSDVDTEDIFQTVFMKYILYSGVFENKEHEKAWFIRITVNACKDFLKSFYRKKILLTEYIEENALVQWDTPEADRGENSRVLQAVLSLPTKYKEAVYLFYFEEYTAAEIGKILNRNENTVYTHLSRAREMLKDVLGGEELD